MIKAIIAEDEPTAIRHLKKIISGLQSNIEIISEVTYPDKVIPAVKEMIPDVVFLDIDFKRKDINGLILADKIFEQFPAVIIIYISAHNQFKSLAWERKAVVLGYIDKPFNTVKVERVLSKISGYISNERLAVKDKNNKVHYLAPDEIIMIEREKKVKNTIIHCSAKKINTTESLISIEKRLVKFNKIIRIHRSFIVNIAKIDNISLYSESSYLIRFKNCSCEAFVSKETAVELELIGKRS